MGSDWLVSVGWLVKGGGFYQTWLVGCYPYWRLVHLSLLEISCRLVLTLVGYVCIMTTMNVYVSHPTQVKTAPNEYVIYLWKASGDANYEDDFIQSFVGTDKYDCAGYVLDFVKENGYNLVDLW